MAEKTEKNTASEADLYIKMGHLLQKERPPELQEAVQKILMSNIPLNEKLVKIERMDMEESAKKNPQKDAAPSAAVKPVKWKENPSFDTIIKNLHGIKQSINKSGLLFYIFTEYRNIQKFARKTMIIRASLFSLRLSVKKSSLVALQHDAVQLMGYLDYCLEFGWMVLTKHDYNLIAILRKLCDAISTVNWSFMEDETQFMDKIKPVENYFLACHYKPEYTDLIQKSVTQVMRNFQKGEDKIEHASLLIRKLLLQTWDNSSLYNLILALNMIYYRKYLKLESLIQNYQSGIIDLNEFDCNETTRGKILDFVKDNEQRLDELFRTRAELNKMSQFLKQYIHQSDGTKESSDFALLMQFYESGTGQDHYRYARDKDNLFIFTNNLLKRFLQVFEGFLNGKIKLDKWGEVSVFTYDFFHLEMSKIENLSQRLSKMGFGFANFNSERFMEIKRNPDRGNPTHSEVILIQILDDISNIMIEMGKKFGHICLIHRKDSNLDINDIRFKSLDPSLLSQEAFNTPIWDSWVIQPDFFKDLAFGQALNLMTALCLLIGVFYYNTKMMSLLEKEIKANEEIRKILSNLERIADPAAFLMIKQAYGQNG